MKISVSSYSFSQYLNDGRLTQLTCIAKAKELIAQGDLTLNAIAEQVGFGNIKTFRRTFQKIENMNPSDYELSSDADQE